MAKTLMETQAPNRSGVMFAIVGYMACSSLMLVANKLAVHHIAAPSFVLWAQLAATAAVVFAAGKMNVIEVDALEVPKAAAYAPVALIFLGTIFTNMKTLQYANVETFIVFRASTPLLISILDWAVLGRMLPSMRSWACLLSLALCAMLYTATDSHFELRGYTFVAIWFAIFTLDQVYLKHVINTVTMRSNWGRVFYTNLLAAIPLVFMGLGAGERDVILNPATWTFGAVSSLALSVALGVAMSYFAWLARSLVSATYFTIIGNSCKLLTVIINISIWDKHASNVGLMCLFGCLTAAYFYKQAPMRSASGKN